MKYFQNIHCQPVFKVFLSLQANFCGFPHQRKRTNNNSTQHPLIHVKCINNYIIVPTYLSLQFLGLIPTPPVSP